MSSNTCGRSSTYMLEGMGKKSASSEEGVFYISPVVLIRVAANSSDLGRPTREAVAAVLRDEFGYGSAKGKSKQSSGAVTVKGRGKPDKGKSDSSAPAVAKGRGKAKERARGRSTKMALFSLCSHRPLVGPNGPPIGPQRPPIGPDSDCWRPVASIGPYQVLLAPNSVYWHPTASIS